MLPDTRENREIRDKKTSWRELSTRTKMHCVSYLSRKKGENLVNSVIYLFFYTSHISHITCKTEIVELQRTERTRGLKHKKIK